MSPDVLFVLGRWLALFGLVVVLLLVCAVVSLWLDGFEARAAARRRNGGRRL